MELQGQDLPLGLQNFEISGANVKEFLRLADLRIGDMSNGSIDSRVQSLA